jgi:hypothetical protein
MGGFPMTGSRAPLTHRVHSPFHSEPRTMPEIFAARHAGLGEKRYLMRFAWANWSDVRGLSIDQACERLAEMFDNLR